MIRPEDIELAGKIVKTHSYNGEVRIEFTQNFDEEAAEFLIVNEDGLPTPFYVEGYKFRSDTTAIYKVEGVDDEATAKKQLVGKEVYVEKQHIREVEEEDVTGTVYALVGYEVSDEKAGRLGKVISIDDNTANTLLIIENENGEEMMVPVAEEYIREIDDEQKTMQIELPEGFLDI